MIFLRSWALVTLASITSFIHPFIYKITTWQHTKTGQYVYIMYDIHIDLPDLKITREQTEAIVKAAQQRNALVIYEGMADYHGDNPACHAVARGQKEQFGKNPMTFFKLLEHDVPEHFDANTIPEQEWVQGFGASPLNLLNPALVAAGVDYKNVEFRHLMNATLIGTATFGQFFQSVEDTINTIESFNDDMCYTTFYQERVATFKKTNQDIYEQKQLRVKLNPELPLYHNVISGPYMRGFLFGVELLEALAVHAMCTAPVGKPVFVIMGGVHAEQMDTAMATFNYTKLHTQGTKFWFDTVKPRHAAHPLDIASALSIIKTS